MRFSQGFLEQIRERIPLSDIIGRRVKLTRAGREYKACCPFHNEKTPSFYVNDEKGFYHCFGCGAHGDVVNFLVQHDRMSFVDAVETLASQAGLKIPQMSEEDRETEKQQKSLYDLTEEACRFMEKQLYDASERVVFDYLSDRGIKQKTISEFRIGFAPQDGSKIINYLEDKGYSADQMLEAGIAKRSSKNGKLYSFFRDRIIFPVMNRKNAVVAFGGRILPDHLRSPDFGDFKPPKYINSPDTSLFHKGEMLYGKAFASREVNDNNIPIIVEGYLDVISCVQAGINTAFAPLGTALTERQIELIWRMNANNTDNTPVICFDGDEAGIRAAARAAQRILPIVRPSCSVKFAFLPAGEDPDSLIKNSGVDSFRSVIDSAMNLSDYIWMLHSSGKKFDTPESRSGLSEILEKEAMKINHEGVRQYYRENFRSKIKEAFWSSNSYNMRMQRRNGEYTPYSRGKQYNRKDNLQNISIKPTGIRRNTEEIRNMILISCAINHPEIIKDVEEDLWSLNITGKELKTLRNSLISEVLENNVSNREMLVEKLSSLGYKEILDKVLSDSIYIHAGFAKPESDMSVVTEGWRNTIELLYDKSILQEVRIASELLADDTSEENERRIFAFYELHKQTD